MKRALTTLVLATALSSCADDDAYWRICEDAYQGLDVSVRHDGYNVEDMRIGNWNGNRFENNLATNEPYLHIMGCCVLRKGTGKYEVHGDIVEDLSLRDIEEIARKVHEGEYECRPRN